MAVDRNFLFIAGEYRVTMKAVFSMEKWTHTMSASRLALTDGRLHRECCPNERIEGIIYYARAEDYSVEEHNLRVVREWTRVTPYGGYLVWPDIDALVSMSDRHWCKRNLADRGLVTHATTPTYAPLEKDMLEYPFVVKTGQSHRGIGKHLIACESHLDSFNAEFGASHDLCTVEPFFTGKSVRVLIIDEHAWLIEYDNISTWIKNSAGADIASVTDLTTTAGGGTVLNASLLSHAWNVKMVCRLDIVGIDYIVSPDGTFHLLEANQFPGLDVSDDVAERAREFLIRKMGTLQIIATVDARSRATVPEFV